MHRQGTWMVVRPQALQRTSISGRTSYSELETAFLLSLLFKKCLRYTYLPTYYADTTRQRIFPSSHEFRICKTTERVQVGLEPSSFTCLNPSSAPSLPSQVTRTDLLPYPTVPYPTRPFIHPSPVPYSYYSRNLQIIIILLLSLFFLLGKTLASPACHWLFLFFFFGYFFIIFFDDEIDPYLIENRTERKNRTCYPRTTG